jgi:hypothetical protein
MPADDPGVPYPILTSLSANPVGATPVYGHPYGSFVADGCLTLRSPAAPGATFVQGTTFRPAESSGPTDAHEPLRRALRDPLSGYAA